MQITYDLSQIDSIAKQIISQAKSNILLFYGEMGVGKTTLIRSLTKHLGVEETASSPTFSIVNEYHTNDDAIIYHFDMYRLSNAEEALDFGFDEYLDQGDWIFIEWPEKIIKYIPERYQKIDIRLRSKTERTLTSKLIC